jgi:HD-GYP domain-containing protein (c-di-GMP phosphodiesterase class II)
MISTHKSSEIQPSRDLDAQKALYQVIKLMIAAVHGHRLYNEQHPQVVQTVEKAFKNLSHLLARRDAITLMIIDQDLVVENRRVLGGGPSKEKFVQILSDKSIERLTFTSGLTFTQFQSMVRHLADDAPLPTHSFDAIKMGKVAGPDRHSTAGESNGEEKPGQDEIEELQVLRRKKTEAFKELYESMEKNRKVDVGSVERIIREFIRRFRSDINPLTLLASVKSSDEYTFTHVVNVCILTMFMAETLGFKGELLHTIGIAASLHDTGKLFIPEDILNKPGRLTPEERCVVEQHPGKGAQYLLKLEGIPKLAILCCLEHHLRSDGGGYPAVPRSYRPHIVSQIISIADAFDAMRSRRVYQEAKPLEQVIRIIEAEKSRAFHPDLADHFLKLIRS